MHFDSTVKHIEEHWECTQDIPRPHGKFEASLILMTTDHQLRSCRHRQNLQPSGKSWSRHQSVPWRQP